MVQGRVYDRAETARRIYEALERPMTKPEIAEASGLPVTRVKWNLSRMAKQYLVVYDHKLIKWRRSESSELPN